MQSDLGLQLPGNAAFILILEAGMSPPTPVRLIANIGWVRSCHPDGSSHTFVGGAGLHLSLAVSGAGGLAAPISVIGGDLGEIVTALHERHVDVRDIKAVREQLSCRFDLSYDESGNLISVASRFRAAVALTEHALSRLHAPGHYHVSCRRPLDVEQVLAALDDRPFSLDFYSPSAAAGLHAAAAFLPAAAVIFTNEAEYRLLGQVVDLERLRLLVISDGGRRVRVISYGRTVAATQPPVVATREVTGAGDTLAGTYLACTLAGATTQDALDAAVRAASDSTQRGGFPGGLP